MSFRTNLALLALFALAVTAEATPVSFTASGRYDTTSGSLDPTLMGSSFLYQFAYDPSEVGSTGGFGAYQYAIYDLTSFRATVDGVAYDLLPRSIFVFTDGDHSGVQFSGYVPTADQDGLLFDLSFTPNAVLTGVDLPSDPLALGEASSVVASLRDISGFGEFYTNGQALTNRANLQAVPEPATVASLAFGALGLVWRRRKTA